MYFFYVLGCAREGERERIGTTYLWGPGRADGSQDGVWARAKALSGCSALGDERWASGAPGQRDGWIHPCLWVPDLLPPLQGAAYPPSRTSYRMAAPSPAAAASLVHLPTSTFQVTALSLGLWGACRGWGWCCDYMKLGACRAWGSALTVPKELGTCSDSSGKSSSVGSPPPSPWL